MGNLLREITKNWIIKRFHKLYYHYRPKIWNNTYWFGVPVGKCPLDLWIYQEIIYELRPDVIIETGSGRGGSTLFFASICDLLNNGRVVSVELGDISNKPQHSRITYLSGSSTSEEIIVNIRELIGNGEKVLINLDSDHSMKHVLEELNLYSEFVSPGSYIIVEDSNVGGHPVKKSHYPGPTEAVKEFIKNNPNFLIDKSKEKFLLTFNPNGYLKRLPV